jgi:hypothetical protein
MLLSDHKNFAGCKLSDDKNFAGCKSNKVYVVALPGLTNLVVQAILACHTTG